MPSSGAVLCLLVLLGAELASCSPVLSHGELVSGELRRAQGIVADELDLRRPEVGVNPIFGAVIKSINASCQRQDKVRLVNATLDVYVRVLSGLLQQGEHSGSPPPPPLLSRLSEAQREKVDAALRSLKNKMETLRSLIGPDREDLLDRLGRMKVDDPAVQQKALAELPEVYQAAAVALRPRKH